MENEKRSDRIGGLWSKDWGLSGIIEIAGEKFNIVVFENTRKKSEKSPDYNVLLARPRNENVR